MNLYKSPDPNDVYFCMRSFYQELQVIRIPRVQNFYGQTLKLQALCTLVGSHCVYSTLSVAPCCMLECCHVWLNSDL